MAIQYTIEMRSMLNDMPVREEIREFLFKVWAEVLAIAAMSLLLIAACYFGSFLNCLLCFDGEVV